MPRVIRYNCVKSKIYVTKVIESVLCVLYTCLFVSRPSHLVKDDLSQHHEVVRIGSRIKAFLQSVPHRLDRRSSPRFRSDGGLLCQVMRNLLQEGLDA